MYCFQAYVQMEHADNVSNGVHARERRAVRDDLEASPMHESLGGNLYKLLIKNVSKNQPLTAEEAQVRNTLTLSLLYRIGNDNCTF